MSPVKEGGGRERRNEIDTKLAFITILNFLEGEVFLLWYIVVKKMWPAREVKLLDISSLLSCLLMTNYLHI